MTSTSADDWSPADNPYAIATSEAQWWRTAAQLAILRMRDEPDPRTGWFSSEQIDARQLIFALRQLLAAEELEQLALTALGMNPTAGDALAQARQQFEDALPGIKHMRDALMHFDEWSRGQGRGPQKDRVRAGEKIRDVAREFWGFGYDPTTGIVRLGPYSIDVEVAGRAVNDLCDAICGAAHEVDKKNTADLRAKTINALISAGIPCDSPDSVLLIPSAEDLRVWVSFKFHSDASEDEHQDLAERIMTALAAAELQLTPLMAAHHEDTVARLVRREPLFVEAIS